jgi:hypothetical protein
VTERGRSDIDEDLETAVEPYDARILITLRDVPVVREDAAPASGTSGRTR